MRSLTRRAYVPERDERKDSHRHCDERARQGSYLKASRERPPRHFDQRAAGRWQFASERQCASESVLCGRQSFRRNTVDGGAGHRPPVDGRPDAAEDRDAERSAEFGAGFRDRGGRTGPLGWRGCYAEGQRETLG